MAPLQYPLSLDWVSMGIIIGKKGDKISPFDLVTESRISGSEQAEVTVPDQTVDQS